jgi:hypothetical protein
MSALDFPAWAVSDPQQDLFATAVGFSCPSVLLEKENTAKKFVDAKLSSLAPPQGLMRIFKSFLFDCMVIKHFYICIRFSFPMAGWIVLILF